MRAANESFLLLHPNPKKNSHEVARRIAACRGVRKTFITSGDFGFVIHIKPGSGNSTERVTRIIKRISSFTKAKTLKGHFVYEGLSAEANKW